MIIKYSLESFTEKRCISFLSKPDDNIREKLTQAPKIQEVWQIESKPKEMFFNHEVTNQIQFTEQIIVYLISKICHSLYYSNPYFQP